MNIITELSMSFREQGLVSPEEQLEKLVSSVANEQIRASQLSNLLKPHIASVLVRGAIEQRTQAILNRVFKKESPVKSLFNLTLEEFAPTQDIPSVLTNWYTALQRLNRLSESIPPLPDDIRTTLESFRAKDLTPLLYFIPGGTLNELENTCRAYWERKHPGEENPFRFRYILDRAREQYGDVQIEPHWGVISDDVIPGSRSKTFERQIALMNALNLECEAPSLYSVVATMFLHKIATNESLYQAGNDQNGNRWTYTRLRETVDNWRLDVGGFAPSGVYVRNDFDYDNGNVGVVALRKF